MLLPRRVLLCDRGTPRARRIRCEQPRRRAGATHQLSPPNPFLQHETSPPPHPHPHSPTPSPAVFPEKKKPPPGPLTSHGVGSPLRAVMKLGAQEPHHKNPVSAPAEAAAAADLLRWENHTSEAAPRGAAPRDARRRARPSLAAAPRPPVAEPLRGLPWAAARWQVASGEAGEGEGKELR